MGGQGGGGKGGVRDTTYPLLLNAASGSDNTGGGGGGATRTYTAGAGGSGVVIISYAQAAATTYTLTYTAGAHGLVSGASSQTQTVASGGNGTAVSADPATGYHFVNWSDSSTTNPRTDSSVTANVSVTANFAINTVAYTTWASTHAGGGLPDGDSDHDGIPNGVEYFMNSLTPVFTANPALNATTRTVTWPNGDIIPSFEYGNQFVVQTSDDLAAWADVSSSDPTHLSNTPGSVSYTFTGTAPRFVRLKVTPNPN